MFKKIHFFRVKPKQELISAISDYCSHNRLTSGIVLGLIGSADSVKINFIEALPGKYVTKEFSGPLEIVSGQGSVAVKENELIIHIHVQFAEQDKCFGGHLVEAKIFSTAEVVIGELDYQIVRYSDKYTGLNELIS